MGGIGSGRRPWRLGVDECRTLEIGEFCDRGRWQVQPRGEVLWRACRGGEVHARLSYAISPQQSAADDLLLNYCYSCDGMSPSLSPEHELELECSPGRRSYAYCPGCGRRVRTLYAPEGAADLACRSCWDLVYRRSQAAEIADVAGLAEEGGTNHFSCTVQVHGARHGTLEGLDSPLEKDDI